jgi:hypothetical protein
VLWGDGVLRLKRPYCRPLNLSIVCLAGPCYFSAKSSQKYGCKPLLRAQVQCGVSETCVSDCRGSGVIPLPKTQFSRSRECVRPAR